MPSEAFGEGWEGVSDSPPPRGGVRGGEIVSTTTHNLTLACCWSTSGHMNPTGRRYFKPNQQKTIYETQKIPACINCIKIQVKSSATLPTPPNV